MLPAQGYWAPSGLFVMEGSVHVPQCGDTLHSIMSGASGVPISWQCWEAVKGGLPCCAAPKGSACLQIFHSASGKSISLGPLFSTGSSLLLHSVVWEWLCLGTCCGLCLPPVSMAQQLAAQICTWVVWAAVASLCAAAPHCKHPTTLQGHFFMQVKQGVFVLTMLPCGERNSLSPISLNAARCLLLLIPCDCLCVYIRKTKTSSGREPWTIWVLSQSWTTWPRLLSCSTRTTTRWGIEQ